MNKISQFEVKLKLNALVSLEKDVPIGFIVCAGEDAKFVLKFSLLPGGKIFDSLEKLMDFVIDN